ncbi:CbtA family protein [Nocardioides ginsengisoli]|uniref:CbtA family protein n=1 Tax=Nocardioides ginsengisoli TaxID=363868 RepID=A0ABW3W6M5_9ACTN
MDGMHSACRATDTVAATSWGLRLRCGAVAGAAGGLASVVVLWLMVEPVIGRAILLEEEMHGRHEAGGAHEHGATVTRLQQQIGGTITVLVVGVLLGLAFAVIYARVQHRFSEETDQGRALSLAALAFTVVAAVPSVMVPANPPGIGSSDTVGRRTLIYLLIILVGVLFVGVVFALHRAAVDRGIAPEGRWLLTAAAVAIGALVVFSVPHVEERVPSVIPADLVWDFRVGSLVQTAALWTTMGIVHGVLLHRERERESVSLMARAR